jgi:radial spoke head protein 4A
MLESHPNDPLAAFDAASHIVLREQRVGADPSIRALPPNNINPYSLPSKVYKQSKGNRNVSQQFDIDLAKRILELIAPKPKPAEGEGEEAPAEYTPANAEFELQNIVADFAVLQNLGVCFSDEDAFRLALSLRRLCEALPIKSARFWGVVRGTAESYYVAECVFQEGQRPKDGNAATEGGEAEAPAEDDESPEAAEKREAIAKARAAAEAKLTPEERIPAESESGANSFVYFVCSRPGDAWSRLPDVSPAQILAARHIKRFFTGNLDAPVISHPPFPGTATERYVLRATIARISAGTLVAPKGMFLLGGDEPEEETDPEKKKNAERGPNVTLRPVELQAEFAVVGSDVLTSLSGWTHTEAALSQVQGRSTLYLPEAILAADQAEAEAGEPDEGAEPKPKREKTAAELEDVPRQMRELSRDAPVLIAEGHYSQPAHAWALRQTRNGAFAVRSTRWPGACAVAYPVGLGPEPEAEEGKPVPTRPTRYRLVNVYCGWGIKAETQQKQDVPVAYAPGPAAKPLTEFVSEPEMCADVTADMEAEFREPEPVVAPEPAEGEADAAAEEGDAPAAEEEEEEE